MFCKNCGAEIADNATFCPKCGSQVNQASNQGNPYQGQPYGGQPYGYQGGGYQPRRTNNAPGKVLLIITGILVLIGGIITLVSDFGAMPYIGWLGGGFAAALIFELIYAVVMIVAGILGIVYCGRPDKGNTVFILGIVIVILRVIDWILASAMFSGLIDVVNASSVILGFIVPILLTVGGYLNKKAA